MKKILIATGGSGGHVIPSLSIYDALKDDFEVKISTDSRGSKFINNENYNYSLIDVPNLFSNLLLLPYNLIKFCFSIIKSYKYLKLNGFKEVFFGSGTSKETLSPGEIFFEGIFEIFPLILSFLSKIKFLILVLLNIVHFSNINVSILFLFEFSSTIKLMIFFIFYNINT